MDARPGDRIEVTPNSLGVEPRRGTVVEAGRGTSLRVRWDDGHETTMVPGSDCRVVEESGPRPATLGCHIDLRISETDERSEAVATLMTSRGTFEGRGVARRHPDDPPVPMIGEELAIGRALDMLSDQLLGEAANAIRRRESEPIHLLV